MTDDAHDRWLAELRVDDEVRRRRREHWLAHQAAETATIVGVLRDLSEQAIRCRLDTTVGRRHHGTVSAVGIDFVAVRTDGPLVLVPLRAVTVVSTGGGVPRGDRMGGLDLTLQEALADRLEDRTRAVVRVDGGATLSGDIVGVGHDLVSLRSDDADRRVVHVQAEAIVEVAFG